MKSELEGFKQAQSKREKGYQSELSRCNKEKLDLSEMLTEARGKCSELLTSNMEARSNL